MIVVALFGGLGNQMFQYANAKALALRNKASLKIDSQFFNEKYQQRANSTLRNYELSVFNLTVEKASPYIVNLLAPLLSLKTKGGFDVNIALNPLFIYENKQFTFQSIRSWKFFYLYGYWQSWRYFQSYEYVIRNEFIFKNSLTGKNLELLNKVRNTQSVSVHVRLGDYRQGNLLPMTYYNEAIGLMKKKIPNATFFVFSDNPDQAKAYFKDLDFEIVHKNNGSDSYIDMQLMSNCKYNIIANSSFSWWGAWLNNYSYKIVIAPSIWYNNCTDTNDILPPDWIKI